MSQQADVQDSIQASSELDDRIADKVAVDLDFHLTIRPHHVVPYIEDKRIANLIENTVPPVPAYDQSPFSPFYAVDEQEMEQEHGTAHTTEDIVQAKEELGLDVVIVTPQSFRFAATDSYPVMKNAVFRAQNDYMLDQVVNPDQGIYGAMGLPKWDPEECVRELDRVGDRDEFVAVSTNYGPHRPMGHIDFDPVFEKLVELNLPIVQHGDLQNHSFDGGRSTYMECLVNDWPYYAQVSCASMIFNGVFEKFPELDVVIQEAGTNWIPHLAHRSDEIYQIYPDEFFLPERMNEMGKDSFDRMPSEYFFDHFHIATQPIAPPSARQIDSWLDMIRADEMLMFSTDFPHASLDIKNWLVENNIPEETQNRILHENALEVFDDISL